MSEAKSLGTFRAIQIFTFLGYLALFGAPLAWMTYAGDGSFALAALVGGGTLVVIGGWLCSGSSARIYDPSRAQKLGTYESGYERHDGEDVYVERQTGTTEATYTKAQAQRMTLNSLIFGLMGLGVGWALSGL